MIDERGVTSEKAVLIGVVTQFQDETKSEEYLDELEFLTLTAGGIAVKIYTETRKTSSKNLYWSRKTRRSCRIYRFS